MPKNLPRMQFISNIWSYWADILRMLSYNNYNNGHNNGILLRKNTTPGLSLSILEPKNHRMMENSTTLFVMTEKKNFFLRDPLIWEFRLLHFNTPLQLTHFIAEVSDIRMRR
jgi:hypothetical protein